MINYRIQLFYQRQRKRFKWATILRHEEQIYQAVQNRISVGKKDL